MNSTFQEWLEHHMLKKGISQKQLAEMTGLQISAISSFQKGRRKPNYDNLKKLVLALNCDAHDLLELPRKTDNALARWMLGEVIEYTQTKIVNLL